MPEKSATLEDVSRPNADSPATPKPVSHAKKILNKAAQTAKKRPLTTIVVAVLLAVVIWLGYGYMHTKSQLNQLSKNAATSQQSQVQSLVSDISKYMVLPDETPTLATVNDIGKLKGQEFFKNAQNGDKVLVFTNAGRALLYRESTHKVIEYSKVDLSNTPRQ